jgi:hypothetical protein
MAVVKRAGSTAAELQDIGEWRAFSAEGLSDEDVRK